MPTRVREPRSGGLPGRDRGWAAPRIIGSPGRWPVAGGADGVTMGVDEDFDAFVRARRRALVRSAYLLTGDQHLAEDLVQSALARTHRAWARIEDPANAEAYTRKVMYHIQVSWWRRHRVAAPPTARPRAGGRTMRTSRACPHRQRPRRSGWRRRNRDPNPSWASMSAGPA